MNVAIHHIHDPTGFDKAGNELLTRGITPEFKLPVYAATSPEKSRAGKKSSEVHGLSR